MSSIIAGFSFAYKLRRKCIVSKELLEMCDLMAIELNYSVSESSKIIKRLSNEPSLSNLLFLKDFNFENINISTELNDVDNERINSLFKNIGKVDVNSMLELLSTFKINMIESNRNYEEYYKTHSRLYIAYAVFGGIVVSLVLI